MLTIAFDFAGLEYVLYCRIDEAKYMFGPAQRLAEALKARGVDPALIDAAIRDIAA